jgi:radical SAM superfamily enzyme YgiQ (UPF0313 family)
LFAGYTNAAERRDKEMSEKIRIAVLNVENKRRKCAMNKDLNGGFGTLDSYSDTVCEEILMRSKKRYFNLPVLLLAFLMGILKQKSIPARFYEGQSPDIEPEIILIYGSMVDYKNENFLCAQLKDKFKNAKIGFIGPFPSIKPELFKNGDFIIVGDFEYFFLKEFRDSGQLHGNVVVNEKIDLDELPSPEIEGFPLKKYHYFPLGSHSPFFTLLASRGCPYSCSYYCVYGKTQGNTLSVRSPKKVCGDILYLSHKYGVRTFQFRDAIFGAKKSYIEKLCDEIRSNNLKIRWGIEIRLDILDKRKVKIMYDAGLRSINTGVETCNAEIATQNKRSLVRMAHQEKLIRYCERIGVKISAFYLFGYEGDTKSSVAATLKYAKKLNTFLARFAVLTPYPSTEFFAKLEKEKRIITYDYERYTQFNLVFKHNDLTEKDMRDMISRAYREYYFRLRYIIKLVIWKIREFWL